MKEKKQYSAEERRNIGLVQMALVKAAQLNIKNIFPSLGAKNPKIHHTKSPSNTRKGSGRKHLQGK